FFDLSVNTTGTGYTFTATGGGLGPITSTAFDVTPGNATQLVFTRQPSNAVAGQTIVPAVQVTALDPAGNLVPTFAGNVTIGLGNSATSFTGNVTIAFGANPGGGPLVGTPTVAAVGGVATFSQLSVNIAATGYTFTANATGMTPVTSVPFDVLIGPPTHVDFG